METPLNVAFVEFKSLQARSRSIAYLRVNRQRLECAPNEVGTKQECIRIRCTVAIGRIVNEE